MTSSFDLQFTTFCKKFSTAEMPGINDQYSRKDYHKFKEKISVIQNSQITEKRRFIDKEIEKAKNIDNEIRSMNQYFIEYDKPDKIPESIDNNFPIGGYQIDDISSLKLEDLFKSAKEFKFLFEYFFSKIKLEENELESIFGSITNYPSIVPISFGLMSINGLCSLFNNIYFNNSSNFDKNDFFKQFVNLLAINKKFINIERIDFKKIDNIDNNFLYNKFDTDIWYGPLESDNVYNDSYGLFYEKNGTKDNWYVYLKYSNELEKNRITINDMIEYLNNPSKASKKSDIEATNTSKNNFQERILYPFDKDKFKESIKIYSQISRKKPLTLIKDITSKTNYVEIEVNTDVYKSMRALLHFSNIYTTYLKLLENFFNNIIECYKIYQSELTIKNNINRNNFNRDDISKLQNKLRNLITAISKIPTKFKDKLVDYSTERSFSLKFLGFKETTYDYFTMYLIDNKDNFMQILLIFFKAEKELKVGGIPLTLKENITSLLNRNIIIALSFFMKYRIKSNVDYIKLIETFKQQANQKTTPEKYISVKTSVSRIITELVKKISIDNDDNSIFKNCKETLRFSIIYFTKLTIQTVKDFKFVNGKSFKSDSDILYKIGELKEYLNQYIKQLREKLVNIKYTIFHQFLYGILSKYIYYAETHGKMKTDIKSDLKDLINSADKKKLDKIVNDRAYKFTNILTKNNSTETKKRLKLLREYKILSEKANSIRDKQINPEIYTSIYWSNYEKRFMDLNGNKKLFVIAVEPVINVFEKFSKVNVYLIDLFQTLKSDDVPKIKNYIKTIDIYGKKIPGNTRSNNLDEIDKNILRKNSVINTVYSNENNIINLTPSLRFIRDIAGSLKKHWSKDISGKIKKTIFGKFFSAEGLHSPGYLGILTPGHKFAKTFGIFRRKDNLGYSATEILHQLINGDLSSSISNDEKIKFSLFMGYNDNQLKKILNTYQTHLNRGLKNSKRGFFDDPQYLNKYKYDPKNPDNDFQIYVIESEDYSSSNKMREWANRLLNSKPLVFPKKYVEDPNTIPFSDFSNIQAPFSRYFIKSWLTHKSFFSKNITDYLFEIYNMIYTKYDTSITEASNVEKEYVKEKAKIFFSNETFFNYNIEERNMNNLHSVTTTIRTIRPTITRKEFIENNNYLVTAGIPEISGQFKTILAPTRVSTKTNMNINRINLQHENIGNKLIHQEESIKLLGSFLVRLRINIDDEIEISDEKRNKFKLKFTENLKINYDNKKIAYINYDKKEQIFYTDINISGQIKILIQITDTNVIFFKIESNFMIKMHLIQDSSSNYMLENKYKDIDFSKIFSSRLNFTTEISKGFLFYLNTEIKNYYKLNFLDDSKKSILDIKFKQDSSNEISYEDFDKISKFYYSMKNSIGIISIQNLNVYKRISTNFHKLDFDTNGFSWKNQNESGTEEDFKNFLKRKTGNTNIEKSFLRLAIDKFKITHSLTTQINGNGKFKIDLNDDKHFIIDINKVVLTFHNNSDYEQKKFVYSSEDKSYYVIMNEQTRIYPQKLFIIDKNKEFYILYRFKDEDKMNFEGELKLDFEKIQFANKFILNQDYLKNTFIIEMIRENELFVEIINDFIKKNGLTYNDFCEIYYGCNVNDTDKKSILFRLLSKNKEGNIIPNHIFSFLIEGEELYLENFDNTKSFSDGEYIEFKKDKNAIYTEENVIHNSGNKYIIVFFNNKFYMVIKDITNPYFELIFDKNYGYNLRNLGIISNTTLNDKLVEISDDTN